jgi:hypothetical protein
LKTWKSASVLKTLLQLKVVQSLNTDDRNQTLQRLPGCRFQEETQVFDERTFIDEPQCCSELLFELNWKVVPHPELWRTASGLSKLLTIIPSAILETERNYGF